MAYSSRTYTPGSSTTTFALTTSGGSPIGYIRESDISVKVNGTTYTNVQVLALLNSLVVEALS